MITPEFELLVRCCGIARNLPIHGVSSQVHVPSGFDEKLFVRHAIRHKTAATALAGLKRLGLVLQPENAGKLKQITFQTRMLRELILEDASAITEAAGKADIPALVLKGPASSLQLYGDALTREYTDLDILVNLPTIDAALPFLADLGWEAEDYRPDKDSAFGHSRLIMRSHHVVFWKKGTPFHMELHDRRGWERELFTRDNIDDVFARAVRLEQDGKTFCAPALPDHAALIISHGTQHAWALLHWLLDAAVIVAGAGLDSQRGIELHRGIAARMRSLDMQPQLKLACELTRKLYPIALPPALESAIISQPPLKKSVAFAFARLQAGAADMTTFRNIIAFNFVFASHFFRTTRGKFSSAFKLFQIPPKDIEALPLPRPLLFLHVPLRPFFILSRRIKSYRERKAGAHG